VDHRVEPPAWLPQGAAPEAAGPEDNDSPAVEDTQSAEDSNAAPEGAPEEFANGNGHDSAYTYSRDDSYHYGEDSPYAGSTSYRSPFTPHNQGTSYASEDSAELEIGPDSEAHENGLPEPGLTGHDLPASGLSGSGLATDGLVGSGLATDGLVGSDLPASGLDDPAMPSTGFPGAGYSDTGSGYADPVTAAYPDPVAPPYPAPEPLAAAGMAADETPSGFGAAGTGTREQHADFRAQRPAFGAATTASGVGAALRAGKQRSTARLSREPKQSRPGSSQARKANLVIARIEPWSVMKFSFLISLVLWIVLFVAVALLYYALSSLGVFDSLQRTLASVTSSQTSSGVDLTKWTSATRILGYTMLLGAVDVVLITAISTVGAVIYNLVTHLGGGIEVTLKETE
jgi:transmembrane protein DUF3566